MEFSVEIRFADMLDKTALDRIAAQGVTAISASFDFVESMPKEKLRECAAALAARGIRVDTAHPRFGSYNSANSLVNQYRVPRQLYLEQLKYGLERMSILGARAAPLHTGGCCVPTAPQWAMELCAESLEVILPAASGCGVILALENTFFSVPQQWDDGLTSGGQPPEASAYVHDDINKLCALIDRMASPYVKGCFDAGHAHYLGNLTGDHAVMGERIVLYHLHDNDRTRDLHLPPGYGTLDWEALGPLVLSNRAAHPAYIEAGPWMRGGYGLMTRQTEALLRGGRRGESRRCLTCGQLILTDDQSTFCGCEK